MQITVKNAEAYLADGKWTVTCADAQGRQYYLINAGLSKCIAEGLAVKVNARGAINADLWNCYVPYGTDAWLLDGCEERQIEDERFGFC